MGYIWYIFSAITIVACLISGFRALYLVSSLPKKGLVTRGVVTGFFIANNGKVNMKQPLVQFFTGTVWVTPPYPFHTKLNLFPGQEVDLLFNPAKPEVYMISNDPGPMATGRNNIVTALVIIGINILIPLAIVAITAFF